MLKESPDTKIEVVFFGDAITGLVQGSALYPEKVQQFLQKGVIFAACNNSLRRYNIDPSKVLPAGVIVVPVAILELVKKQEEGWSYIKM